MRDSKKRDVSRLLRIKQLEVTRKAQSVALLGTMIRDFDNMIAVLDRQIAAEEDCTRIKDTGHPAYSTFARAASKRRQNLLISVADIKSRLDAAKSELDEVTIQLRDLKLIQNNQPTFAPASSTPEATSAAR
jgi:hypothetical protein